MRVASARYSMRYVLTTCLLVTLGLFPREASAQPSSADDQEARALFDAGTVAFQQGRFDRALGHFVRAYELSGRPLMLFNIANTHDRLGNSQEALDYFRRYLAEVPDAENASFVRGRVEVLQSRTDSSEPAANGVPDETQGAEDGTDPTGEPSPAGGGAGVGVGPVSTGAGGGGDDPGLATDTGSDSTLGIVLTAVGGGLVAASVGTLVWWLDRDGAIQQCNETSCTNGPDLEAERDMAMATTITLAVLGLAGVGIGVALVATAEDETGGVALRCSPGLAGVACAGQF